MPHNCPAAKSKAENKIKDNLPAGRQEVTSNSRRKVKGESRKLNQDKRQKSQDKRGTRCKVQGDQGKSKKSFLGPAVPILGCTL